MVKVKTGFKFSEREISYEILNDGYIIYLDEVPWIKQQEPFIPYTTLGYEGSCIKQIQEICKI